MGASMARHLASALLLALLATAAIAGPGTKIATIEVKGMVCQA
jgi:hypothetical protein